MIVALTLAFFDVNLGNSTLIKTSKMNILFDVGCNEKMGINPLFLFKGDLDYLIISHPHKDHISGLSRIDNKKPKVFLRNNHTPLNLIHERIESSQTMEDKQLYEKYLELCQKYNKSVQDNTDPENPSINGNVIFKHFIPSRNDIKDLNYYSLTTLLEYEGVRILLMGDNTKSNIEELLDNYNFLKKTENIDLLLAPIMEGNLAINKS